MQKQKNKNKKNKCKCFNVKFGGALFLTFGVVFDCKC